MLYQGTKYKFDPKKNIVILVLKDLSWLKNILVHVPSLVGGAPRTYPDKVKAALQRN